jgi:hypothetical protein
MYNFIRSAEKPPFPPQETVLAALGEKEAFFCRRTVTASI